MLFRPKLLCNPFTGFRRQWHSNQTITRSPATHREVLHCGLWIGRTQVWKTPRCLPASWSWRPVPHPHPYYPRGGHISLQISNCFFHIWFKVCWWPLQYSGVWFNYSARGSSGSPWPQRMSWSGNPRIFSCETSNRRMVPVTSVPLWSKKVPSSNRLVWRQNPQVHLKIIWHLKK